MQARITWYGQECDAAADVTTHIVGAPTDRLPQPVPVLPANASTAGLPAILTTVATGDGTVTENGTVSTTTSTAGDGVVVSGNTTEFSEVVAVVLPCGEGTCITNYGQCSGEIRGEIIAEPLPCCGRVFECVQQSARYGLCLPKGSKLPPDWDGEVVAGYCGY